MKNFQVGQRVELDASLDLAIRGARHGTVQQFDPKRRSANMVLVKFDKLTKPVWCPPDVLEALS